MRREGKSEQEKRSKNQVTIQKEENQNNHLFMSSQAFCSINDLQVELGASFEGVREDCTSSGRYVGKLSTIEVRMLCLKQSHSWDNDYIDRTLLTRSVLGCSLLNIPAGLIVGRYILRVPLI